MKKLVIGFGGFIGSGKSTAADYLVTRYGFTKEKFAGPLKDMCRALGLNEREVEGDLKEKPCELLGGQTPRWAQQSLGTEWGRNLIHPELWTRAWLRRTRSSSKVVADDVRFENEAQLLRTMGGAVVMISRQAVEPKDEGKPRHASEAFGFAFDYKITNDGTIDELYAKIDKLVEGMK